MGLVWGVVGWAGVGAEAGGIVASVAIGPVPRGIWEVAGGGRGDSKLWQLEEGWLRSAKVGCASHRGMLG